jgi:acetyltransferase-like isoleucine patch superfamily enzyme
MGASAVNSSAAAAASVKLVVKAVLDAVAFLLVSPLVAFQRLIAWGLPSRAGGTLQAHSQLLSLLPGLTGIFLRRAYYRATLDECPRDCSIGFGTIFATTAVRIGSGTYIGEHCNIGDVLLGRDVLIGSNVTILSGRHQHHIARLDVPVRHQGGTYTPVSLGDDVWIGNGAIVAADVAAHAVVAAGAVVVKPVAAFAIMGGNPARQIGSRDASSAGGISLDAAVPASAEADTGGQL